jgi:hypothetical protein
LGERAYSHARTHLHGVLERDARDGVSAPDGVRECESPEVGGAPEGTRRRLPDDAPHAPWRAERRLEHGAVRRDRVPRPADAGRSREVRRRQPLQERAQQVNREARGDRDQIGLRARRLRGGGRGAVGHGGGGAGRWGRVAGGGCWEQLAGIDRRLLLRLIVGSCRRFLLGSTVSCKVSSAKGYWTSRFDVVERRIFSVFLIAI